MGPELYSPSGSDFPSDFSDPLEFRYLPGRAGTEGLNPHAKHHRRPLSWTQWELRCAQVEKELVEDHDALRGSVPEESLRYMQHIVDLAKTDPRWRRQYNKYHCSLPCSCNDFACRRHVTKGYRKGCMNAVDEGQALAWSDIVLPGDDARGNSLDTARGRSRSTPRSRSSSPPSLGRQDAFRDSRTTKKRSYRTMSAAASAALAKVVTESEVTEVTSSAEDDVENLYRLGLLHHHDDDDVEQLYQMGLLYDNAHERGFGFTFDAIDRNEPLYKLDVRPTKCGRKHRVGGRSPNTLTSAAPRNSEEESIQLELALNLSLAAFGEDEELAAFLISPSKSDILTLDDDVEEDSVSTGLGSKRRRTESPARIEKPLTVIYELEDDDYSQEDEGESQEISHGFNNCSGYDEVEDETWAFVDGGNDESEDFIYEECNAAVSSAKKTTLLGDETLCIMKEDGTGQDEDQDAWIHILRPSRRELGERDRNLR